MNVTNNSFTVGADSIGDGGERDILSSGIPKGGDETRLAVPCGLYAYGRVCLCFYFLAFR